MIEVMFGECIACQRVSPVVTVAHEDRRQMSRFAEQVVGQYMLDLPVAFLLLETQVPVNEVQRPFGRRHDGQLGAARLALAYRQRDLVLALKRPARQ